MHDYRETLLRIYEILYRIFGPQHWWPGDSPLEVSVGAILTQNTNWTNVERAINNLKRHGVMDIKRLHEIPVHELALLIKPAGYFNVKAKRLKEFIGFLVTNYKGDMKRMAKEDTPILRDKLLGINGIGRETADSILLYAIGKPVFVIDAYTRRVISRHGITGKKRDYDEIQEIFHKNLPHDVRLFNEYHALFVRVGKDFCKPLPRCEGCPLKVIPSP